MSHYFAINIGPIGLTLSMARRPRELWQASYMFSYLMKNLIDAFTKTLGCAPISPCIKPLTDPIPDKAKAGVYPDRVFFRLDKPVKDEVVNATLDEVLASLRIGLSADVLRDYFNIMTATCEADADYKAVKALNTELDYLELIARTPQPGTVEAVLSLLQKKFDSPLFQVAFEGREFPIETLEGIAAYEHEVLKAKRKTYHNYICIVQADGDNVGKTVTNEKLKDGQLAELSAGLGDFAQNACQRIAAYGGMPIYAGGDDLLFIAPLWGGEEGKPRQSVFQLLQEIDEAFNPVCEIVEKCKLEYEGKPLSVHMSYGLSFTYAKYPLYEALKIAEGLLWKVKGGKQKNAIAWRLQKHSGSVVEGYLNKSWDDVCSLFMELLGLSVKQDVVSSVSHKIRANRELLGLFINEADEAVFNARLAAFFDKVVDVEGKDDNSVKYMNKVQKLIDCLRIRLREQQGSDDISVLQSVVYGILRTAKFFNGEEEKI